MREPVTPTRSHWQQYYVSIPTRFNKVFTVRGSGCSRNGREEFVYVRLRMQMRLQVDIVQLSFQISNKGGEWFINRVTALPVVHSMRSE